MSRAPQGTSSVICSYLSNIISEHMAAPVFKGKCYWSWWSSYPRSIDLHFATPLRAVTKVSTTTGSIAHWILFSVEFLWGSRHLCARGKELSQRLRLSLRIVPLLCYFLLGLKDCLCFTSVLENFKTPKFKNETGMPPLTASSQCLE